MAQYSTLCTCAAEVDVDKRASALELLAAAGLCVSPRGCCFEVVVEDGLEDRSASSERSTASSCMHASLPSGRSGWAGMSQGNRRSAQRITHHNTALLLKQAVQQSSMQYALLPRQREWNQAFAGTRYILIPDSRTTDMENTIAISNLCKLGTRCTLANQARPKQPVFASGSQVMLPRRHETKRQRRKHATHVH